jgi:hypothetical protein
MTLAVSHAEGDVGVLDLVHEIKPPFSPKAAVIEFSRACQMYRCDHVTGDRYGGEWPVEAFRDQGIEYRTCERSKSDLYVDTLPLLNSKRAQLLDDKRMVQQFLTSRTLRFRGNRAGQASAF